MATGRWSRAQTQCIAAADELYSCVAVMYSSAAVPDGGLLSLNAWKLSPMPPKI